MCQRALHPLELTDDLIHLLDIDMNADGADRLEPELERVADGHDLDVFFLDQTLQAGADGGPEMPRVLAISVLDTRPSP